MSFNVNFIKAYAHTTENRDDIVDAWNSYLDVCIHSDIYTTLEGFNAKSGNLRIKLIKDADLWNGKRANQDCWNHMVLATLNEAMDLEESW